MVNRKTTPSNNGWIALHRDILDWEWYADPVVRSLFIHLLLIANHTTKQWRGETIARGCCITGQHKLASQLGYTRMQIRTALNKLKLTNEITIRITSEFSYITINNYDRYQRITNGATSKQPASNQQVTTTNNVNNDNNVTKREFSRFEDLTPVVLQDIADKYEVPLQFVEEQHMDMEVWMGRKKTNRYKDYRLALMKWVRDKRNDFVKQARSSKRGGVVDVRS